MKYISFAIPCYNSEAYMEKAINSILPGGDDVEIIVVNDGSKDGTQEIAERYQEKYPNIVKAVQKENGGHGDAVNYGLAHATGKYFKVVDSDDWVDEDSLLKILEAVKDFTNANSEVDMIISNYVYEKVGMEHKKVIRYDNVLPENQIFRWDDIGRFRLDQYILMHSVIYRTQMLKLCQLKLPKHTFYVDNIYVYYPLPHVRTLYYLNVDFYRYFIGREDQSVNEKVMISRIDQQLFVTKSMIAMYELRMITSKKTPQVHDKLSGYYDDCVFNPLHPFKEGGEPNKKERTVGLSEEKRLQNLFQDPLRHSRTDYESPGASRKKGVLSRIQCRETPHRF